MCLADPLWWLISMAFCWEYCMTKQDTRGKIKKKTLYSEKHYEFVTGSGTINHPSWQELTRTPTFAINCHSHKDPPPPHHLADMELTGFGNCGNNLKCMVFKHIIHNSTLGTDYKITFRSIPHLTKEKLTLFQVLVWCCQPSHYLSQCWPRSMSLGHSD